MTAAKNTAAIITMRPFYLDRASAAAALSVSESTFETLVAQREAPQPRKISAGRVGWLTHEIEQFALTRPASNLPPPPGCGHGRAGKPQAKQRAAPAP